MPYYDDFEVMLDTVNRIQSSTSVEETIEVLRKPINEHFPVFARLASWTLYSLLGNVSFIANSIFGFSILAFLAILIHSESVRSLNEIGMSDSSFWIGLISSTCLFSLGIWVSFVMVMVSLSGIAGIFFAALGYFLLVRKNQIVPACIAFFISATCQANGVVAFFPAFLWLIIVKKRWIAGSAVGLFGVLVVIGYSMFGLHADSSKHIFSFSLQNVWGAFAYAMCFLGSNAAFTHQRVPQSHMLLFIPFLLGVALIGVFIRAVYSSKARENWLLLLLLFILITVAGGTLARFDGDISRAVIFRNRFYSCVAFSIAPTLISLCLVPSMGRTFIKRVSVVSCFLWILNLVWVYPMIEASKSLKTTLYMPRIVGYKEVFEAQFLPILLESMRRNVFIPPASYVSIHSELDSYKNPRKDGLE